MTTKPRPIKVARDLPAPQPLSQQDLERIDAEATKSRAAVAKATATLERLEAQDLRIRLR